MPQLPPFTRSQDTDLTGLPAQGLALANAMNPTTKELRSIRILLGLIYNALTGSDIDISQFGTTEALEG